MIKSYKSEMKRFWKPIACLPSIDLKIVNDHRLSCTQIRNTILVNQSRSARISFLSHLITFLLIIRHIFALDIDADFIALRCLWNHAAWRFDCAPWWLCNNLSFPLDYETVISFETQFNYSLRMLIRLIDFVLLHN